VTISQEWIAAYAAGKAPRSACSPDLYMILLDIGKLFRGASALELGCGTAANYPSFKTNGFNYFGIDGSADALNAAVSVCPELEDNLACGDFTEHGIPKNKFYVIADRAAIAHNDSEAIKRCVKNIHEALPVNGYFIGVDWFSTKHSEFWRGERTDELTRTGYTDGQFANVGTVHFNNQQSLEELFSDFQIVMLRERVTHLPAGYPHGGYHMKFKAPFYDGQDYHSAVWDILVVKE